MLYTWHVIFGQSSVTFPLPLISNTNVPQDGSGMYPSSCFTFNFRKLNSLPFYVKIASMIPPKLLKQCLLWKLFWVPQNFYKSVSKYYEWSDWRTVCIFGQSLLLWSKQSSCSTLVLQAFTHPCANQCWLTQLTPSIIWRDKVQYLCRICNEKIENLYLKTAKWAVPTLWFLKKN